MQPSQLAILYVDDSAAQLAAFARDLQTGPYQVRTALNAREAREAIKNRTPDLVIIDYHMPDMMGDACLRLLKDGGAPTTRYYLYTTDPSAFRRHREMGFDGVLMLKGRSSVRNQIDAVAGAISRFRG